MSLKSEYPLNRGSLYRGFLTLEKPEKIWDQTVLSLKCGYPLNRGATKVGFHCTVGSPRNNKYHGTTYFVHNGWIRSAISEICIMRVQISPIKFEILPPNPQIPQVSAEMPDICPLGLKSLNQLSKASNVSS